MDQKVIPAKTHKLPIEKIDPHAIYITEKLKEAGFIAYLVGGSVRDLLLGHVPKDFDISTSAKPEEIKKVFRNCLLIGRRFRLAHIRFGRKIFEVSTFRTGDLEKEELILRDNQWGYPEEDAFRRDFTINGLFYDPSNETIIDYVEGYADIKRRLLRTIGNPYTRFVQDPVRMLRLLKFQARFDLEVDPEAHIAMVECKKEILKSASARVLEEVLRMLESGASQPFFELMTEHGLIEYLVPEIAQFIEKDPDGEEIYDYLDEVDAIFQDPSSSNLDRSVILGSLSFPILEKRIKTQFLDREHIPHLGQIQDQTHDLVNDLFQGFFRIPRRLKVGLINILIGQYRLTPLQKKKVQRRRIPKDADFGLALSFLRLRCCLEPGLQKIHDWWMEAYERVEEKEKPSQRRRRRPRKRRR
ncbi:MAG: Poly(A) polymerase I [Chlamydiae bacterium]|nr:Poly(A) polymerase I [Chlamydiota bacterium]